MQNKNKIAERIPVPVRENTKIQIVQTQQAFSCDMDDEKKQASLLQALANGHQGVGQEHKDLNHKDTSNESSRKATSTRTTSTAKNIHTREDHRKRTVKFRKAPQAPKKARSSFILFSQYMHRTIKVELHDKKSGDEKVFN